MKTVKKEMIYQITSDREINWNKFGRYRRYAGYCRYRQEKEDTYGGFLLLLRKQVLKRL